MRILPCCLALTVFGTPLHAQGLEDLITDLYNRQHMLTAVEQAAALAANGTKDQALLLVEPDDFLSRSTESLFSPLIAETPADDGWAHYLRDRYAFLAYEPDIKDEKS